MRPNEHPSQLAVPGVPCRGEVRNEGMQVSLYSTTWMVTGEERMQGAASLGNDRIHFERL